jgi:hypothetical protein
MHIADYILLGFLIGLMLLAARIASPENVTQVGLLAEAVRP